MSGLPRPLLSYFELVFVPAELQNVSQDTRRKYWQAMRKFVAWCGCDIDITSVSDGLIERFAKSLVANGTSLDEARKIRAFHSDCGDRFNWVPPHNDAIALGIARKN